MEDNQLKYIKYKKKYLQLKSKIQSGGCLQESLKLDLLKATMPSFPILFGADSIDESYLILEIEILSFDIDSRKIRLNRFYGAGEQDLNQEIDFTITNKIKLKLRFYPTV